MAHNKQIGAALLVVAILALDATGSAIAQQVPCPTMVNPFSPFIALGEPAYDQTNTVWIETQFPNAASPSLCSGTLVGQNHVLTAAHCVCRSCRIQVGFGPGPKVNDNTQVRIDVVARQYAPGFRINGPVVQPGQDLSLLTIADHAICEAYRKPAGIVAIRSLVQLRPTNYVVVGYGLTEKQKFGEKLRTNLVSSTINCAQGWAIRSGCISFAEFVLESKKRPVRSTGEGADTCKGDSGGPVFVQGRGPNLLLAGVTSRALQPRGGFDSGGCGFGGIYEHVGIPATVEWLKINVRDLKVE